jgi:hypothetical protein
MKKLGLPDKPELMLQGTIFMMEAITVFANVDRQRISEWLRSMQTYNPLQSSSAHYSFTFDLCGKVYARVMVDGNRLYPMDLADLFGYPWKEYKVAGFNNLWIAHADWSPLSTDEIGLLEKKVTGNLLFDYAENELDIWFDNSIDPSYLKVSVYDREPKES